MTIGMTTRCGEIRDMLGRNCLGAIPVGSRVTCSPPPIDTDEDWLVLCRDDVADSAYGNLLDAGFKQDGSPQFYTGNDNGGFRSWRRGELNIVTTKSDEFFYKFLTATNLAKRFNLLAKADRIALFQAVLYGVPTENLQPIPADLAPTDPRGDHQHAAAGFEAPSGGNGEPK